jgi:signal transduction histidine kinase
MIGSLKDVTEVKVLEEQLAEERLQKQKDISESVIRVLEREKTLIGYELHDNINQLLAVIRLYIGSLNPGTEEENQIKGLAIEQLNNVIEEIRGLSKELVTPRLKKDGLVESIKELIDSINISKQLRIEFSYDLKTYPISVGKKVTLFRIIQEQLRNILKHSKATDVNILLHLRENEVQLHIEDNGIGFDPGKRVKGIGLSNIHERTKFYNGIVDIQAKVGEGCRMTIKIPIF